MNANGLRAIKALIVQARHSEQEVGERLLRRAEDALDAQADSLGALRELVWRVVTGDGAQLENLDLTDAEWESLCEDHGDDRENFTISLHLDDWLQMVRIARAEGEHCGNTRSGMRFSESCGLKAGHSGWHAGPRDSWPP